MRLAPPGYGAFLEYVFCVTTDDRLARAATCAEVSLSHERFQRIQWYKPVAAWSPDFQDQATSDSLKSRGCGITDETGAHARLASLGRHDHHHAGLHRREVPPPRGAEVKSTRAKVKIIGLNEASQGHARPPQPKLGAGHRSSGNTVSRFRCNHSGGFNSSTYEAVRSH